MIVARGYITLTNIQGSANLLDWQSQWKEGSLPAGWQINGVAAENSIVSISNPYNIKSLAWKCTPIVDNPAGNGGDAGGFNTPNFVLDNVHTYRYTVFFFREKKTKGYIDHGTWSVDNLDGTENTNPYFVTDNLLPAGEWFLLVGYIHPSKADAKWQMSTSGVYDMTGKKRLTANRDYKLRTPNVPVFFRTFQYGTDNPEDVAYFYNPRLEVCDGNEPSIEQLLQVSTRDEIDAVKVEYKSEIQKLDNKIAFSVSEVKSYADNKATSEASKAVGVLQIGGRNLYKKSTVIQTLIGTVTKEKEESSDSKNGFKLTFKGGVYSGVRLLKVIPSNANYVVSFWAKSTLDSELTIDICDRSDSNSVKKITTEWSKYEMSILVDNFTDAVYNFVDISTKAGIAYPTDISYWFKDFKIESGNKATDWSPAPEDVASDATAKADAARVAAEAVASAKAELAKTTAQAYADGKVTAEERRAIADAQAKLNEAKADAQAKANAAQTAATAAAAVDATNKANNAQNNAINDAATKYTTKTEHSSAITLLSNQIEQRVTKTVFDNAISDAQLLAKAMSRGLMLYDDPTFKKGVNTIKVYNNTASGSVVITREQVDGIPNDSGYGLKIQNINGNSTPDLGGFYFGIATKANKVMVCRFVAKVPENQRITFASNAYGAGGSISKWLTSNAGTGKWEEYAYYVKCGETGNFSTTFFFYLNKLADQTYPVTWYLAYATVYDLNANEVFTPRAEYEAKITVLENSITSKVSQGSFDALGMRVSSAESNITQQAAQIASKVSQSTFDALGNRVTAAESSITQIPTQIALAVSTSEEKIKTSLTLDSTGISLLGKKIALTGVVTFSALASDAQSKVNTAQSTANTASSKADAAQSTANSAVSKADTAQSGLTALIGKLGDLSYQDMVSLAKLDTTIIEGGHIKTNLIDANAIITNALLAEKIAATDITTSRLTVTNGAKIGEFSIENGNLVCSKKYEISPTKIMNINTDSIRFVEKRYTDNKLVRSVAVGTSTLSVTTGIKPLITIIDEEGDSANVGMYINVSNQNSITGGNVAIMAHGGAHWVQGAGDKWKMPGVLWAGRINANGGVQSHWGDGCRVSQASATAVGFYDIYHDLGHTDYYVLITSTPYTTNGDKWVFGMVVNKYNNYFTVQILDANDGPRRCVFEVAIIGRNTI